jgi:Cellulose biosynthesis protein BcsS
LAEFFMSGATRAVLAAGSLALALSGASSVFAGDRGPIAPGVGTIVFSGSDYKESSNFSYIGAVHAFNGNLGTDGFLVRIFGGFGNYEYDTPAVLGGNVDTDLFAGDLTIGYQTFGSGLRLSGYIGASYENHDRSPEDPGNVVQGDEVGFKGILELETLENSPIYVGAIAGYSTGFDSYWARGRMGANVGRGIVIGPEIIGLGNEGFDQIRYGAFISGLPSLMSLVFGGDGKMSAAVGYADSAVGGSGQGGDDSVYVSIGSSFSF